MKKTIITLMALTGSLFAANSSATWTGVASSSVDRAQYTSAIQITHPVTVTFTQSGSSVTGTLKPGSAPAVAIANYSVSGTSVNFTAGSFVAHLQLNPAGTQLKGTLYSSDGTTASVLLQKQ